MMKRFVGACFSAPIMFVAGAVLLSACGAPPVSAPGTAGASAPKPGIDVVELSATEARAKMASGELTSAALTQAYLDRIAKVDDAGPTLGAIIEINPSAVADATALDEERKGGKLRGPLHGIPVLLKDNIDALGMANSAGSLALADNRPLAVSYIADWIAGTF